MTGRSSKFDLEADHSTPALPYQDNGYSHSLIHKERAGGLRRESPSTGAITLAHTITCKSNVSNEHNKIRSILDEILKILRQNLSRSSVVHLPDYPLLSPYVKIYRLPARKSLRGCIDE